METFGELIRTQLREFFFIFVAIFYSGIFYLSINKINRFIGIIAFLFLAVGLLCYYFIRN